MAARDFYDANDTGLKGSFDYNDLLGGLNIFQGMTSISGGFTDAAAFRQQGEYQQQMYELDATISEFQGGLALERGEKEAERVRRRGNLLLGQQKAGFAGQGVDVGYGSAADVQADGRKAVVEDVLTTKNNAWLEAWGYKVQATQARGKGRMAKIASDAKATNSLISGFTDAVGSGVKSWAYFKK